MANLPNPEEPKYVDVYQLETSDPVQGGLNGVSNKPIRDLVDRTHYLYKQAEKLIPKDNIVHDAKNADKDKVVSQFGLNQVAKNAIPVGAIVAFPKGKLTTGFLKLDGSTFDKVVHPDLFSFLGSNVLPNYSGDSQEKTAIGSIAYFAHDDIDDTWLVLDGGMTSQAKYPELYQMLGTRYGAHGQRPNAQGLFVRSLGGVSGRDAGRVLGSIQEDSIQELKGNFSSSFSGGLMGTMADGKGVFANVISSISNSPPEPAPETTTKRFTTTEFDAGRVARVSNETRGVNIAFYLCVKAKTTATNSNIDYAIKAFGSIENPSSVDLKTIQDALNRLKLSDRLDLNDSNTGSSAKAAYDLNLKINEETAIPKVIWFKTNQPLPSKDIGPIWHEKYASMMQWVVYDKNGANYAGYASINIGRIPTETQPVLRTGYIRSGASSYNQATYPALFNWAKHNGLVKPKATWSAGTLFYRDNGDGTFTPPDVRGEFSRYWDDGRNIDGAREFGTWQDATAIAGTPYVGNQVVFNDPVNSDGVLRTVDNKKVVGDDDITTTRSGIGIYKVRPRNFAALAAIKH